MSARKKKTKKKAGKARGQRPAKAKARSRAVGPKRARPSKAKKAKGKSRPASRRPAPKRAAPKAAAARKAAAIKAKKAREREQKLAARAREAEKKARERAKKEAEREREALRRQKEREREKAQREREKAAAEKQREREKAQREREKKRIAAEREKEKARAKKEALARKAAERAAREAEKKRIAAEREAAKEAARKAKEEERARREAERDAYRKAKEAERERLRAEREAARRLREGKVARATRAQQRVDGLRVGTTRVYDPAAIPNQSGTTRRAGEFMGTPRLVGVRPAEPSSVASSPAPLPERRPTPPPVTPQPPVQEGVEQRYRRILERLDRAGDALKKEYESTLEMSWIHHDSALEGVVYTFQELSTAMDPSSTATPDSSMQPVCDEIRRHRQAIAYVRDLGERKRVPLNVDVVKKLFVMLHPEEGDVKTVKYRKDIPQHRLYFHEYAPPDKIAYRVRQIMDWLNGPEAKKMKSPLRVGARVHYDLLRVFPFAQDSGKVARLLMNVILLRGGYPPAIIHSTERQRYYEALKGQLPVIIQLVNESISNALASIEKRLDEHEARVAS
jgi:hypothetical protein